jgi:hypothetical protein
MQVISILHVPLRWHFILDEDEVCTVLLQLRQQPLIKHVEVNSSSHCVLWGGIQFSVPHIWTSCLLTFLHSTVAFPCRKNEVWFCHCYLNIELSVTYKKIFKNRVFVPPLPVSVNSLKQCITAVASNEEDMLWCVWNKLDYPIDICRVTKGSHIEHLYL